MARRAGIMQAASATASRTAGTLTNVTRSRALMPWRKLDTSVPASAAPSPIAAPSSHVAPSFSSAVSAEPEGSALHS